jgi:hypothetical protein
LDAFHCLSKSLGLLLFAISTCTSLYSGEYRSTSFSIVYSDKWHRTDLREGAITLRQMFSSQMFEVTVMKKPLETEGMICELLHERQENPCTFIHVYELLCDRYNDKSAIVGGLISYTPVIIDYKRAWMATYDVVHRAEGKKRQYLTHYVIPLRDHAVVVTAKYDKKNYEGGQTVQELIKQLKITGDR